MRANRPDMLLDAFLERIPFSPNYRYVRRGLTHYAVYRAQRDLPMTPERQPRAGAGRLG